MKKLLLALLVAVGCLALPFAQSRASADTTLLSTHSWDPGLYSTVGQYNDTVHAWGRRSTSGAWGTGPVNYQSGATANQRAHSSGTLTETMQGTYCPGGVCSYGSGTGYKGLTQFWNDPNNFIAFGLIHDPGVSPNGITIMIEGAGNGHPVGGYWPAGAISGASHTFSFTWTSSNISMTIDGKVTLGPYPVVESQPSISFLAAGRLTGDITDTTFSGINFSPGSVVATAVTIPPGSPYVDLSANVTEGGSGTGHSAYINTHDGSNNALSVGIQKDSAAPQTNGVPSYIWERVQNGNFTFAYLGSATPGSHLIELKWWSGSNTAVFFVDGVAQTDIQMTLVPRLFVQIEGNARLNGDSVNDTFTNVQATVGNNCPQFCGLNGAWSESSFHGLTATNTNGKPQNGAKFTVTGTVSGLASGHNWDTDLVAGIAMIAQYWNGA